MGIYKPCPWGPGKKDLSNAVFNHTEIKWLIWKSEQQDWSVVKVEKYYNLKPRRVQNYVTRDRNGKSLTGKRGRPSRIGPEQEKELSQKLSNRKYQLEPEQVEEYINDLAKKWGESLGKNPRQISAVSKRTLARLKARLEVQKGNAEMTTTARAKAVEDIRNFVSFAAVLFHLDSLVPYYLTVNIDSSVFTVGEQFKTKKRVEYVGKIEGCVKTMPEKGKKQEGPLGIKAYLPITGGGSSGNLVFIIPQEDLQEEENYWEEVPGLGIGVGVSSTAYLVFMASKTISKSFLNNYHEKVLIPLLVELRKQYFLTIETPAWLQLDGECTHIKYYENYSVLEELEKVNLLVTKSPASTTAVTQPCDNGGCFKGTKTTLYNLKRSGAEINPGLESKLKTIMKNRNGN